MRSHAASAAAALLLPALLLAACSAGGSPRAGGSTGTAEGSTTTASTTAASTATTAVPAVPGLGLPGSGASGGGPTIAFGAAATAPVAPPANCSTVPAKVAPVSWLPPELPMPAGSYVVRELPTQPPIKGAIFVIPMGIRGFVTFVLAEYPKAGWRLGRGDAEPTEAEDSFARGTAAGAFRIRQPFCDQNQGELQISYIADVQAAPRPTPTTDTTPTTTTTTSTTPGRP